MSRILVHRPQGMRFTMLRQELLNFFDGDACSALIAHTLETWTACRIAEMEHKQVKEGLLWLSVSEEALSTDMLGQYGIRRIRDSLQSMADKGVIECATNVGKARNIIYNYMLVDQCVTSGTTIRMLPGIGGIHYGKNAEVENGGTPAVLPTPSAEMPGYLGKKADFLPRSEGVLRVEVKKDKEEEEYTEKPIYSITGNSSGENPRKNAEPTVGSGIVKTLVSMFKYCRGISSVPKPCRDIIESKLSKVGHDSEHILACFEDWKVETFWRDYVDTAHKIRSFFSYLEKWQPGSKPELEPGPFEAALLARQRSPVSESTPSPLGMQPASPQEPPARVCIGIWNAAFPESMVDPAIYAGNTPWPLRDAAMAQYMGPLVEKVRWLRENGSLVSFADLLINEKSGGFRWQRILAGGWDWTVQKKPMTKSEKKDDFIERKIKEIAARKAAKATADGTRGDSAGIPDAAVPPTGIPR